MKHALNTGSSVLVTARGSLFSQQVAAKLRLFARKTPFVVAVAALDEVMATHEWLPPLYASF